MKFLIIILAALVCISAVDTPAEFADDVAHEAAIADEAHIAGSNVESEVDDEAASKFSRWHNWKHRYSPLFSSHDNDNYENEFRSYGAFNSKIDASQNLEQVPANFKIAMIADTGLNVYTKRLWRKLAEKDQVNLVIHPGDFAYSYGMSGAFMHHLHQVMPVNDTVRPPIPYVTTTGDHDMREFGKYRAGLVQRDRDTPGLKCEGRWGYVHVCTYKGIVMIGAGLALKRAKYEDVLNAQLKRFSQKDPVTGKPIWRWKFCLWHRNAEIYQVGDKDDGIDVHFYDICRQHGAIIVTGHQHTYSRTHEMLDFAKALPNDESVASNGRVSHVFPGQSLAIVTGLSGAQPRSWIKRRVTDRHWVSVMAKQNFVSVGGLICTLNVDGLHPSSADC